MGVGGPEGRVRHGVPGIHGEHGRDRRRGDGGQEAEGRRQLPAGGDRRDRDLPAAGVPGRAPQAHPHEQHDRTAQPRDQAAHARRGKLPGREQRAHARLRAHQVRHRERMVQPALPRHVPARRQSAGSELIIAPWTSMIQSAQPFGHYHRITWQAVVRAGSRTTRRGTGDQHIG